MTSSLDPTRLPKHVAIIMDGNGRWAKRRGLPRLMGHRQGVKTVRSTIRTTRELGIPVLTLYAFSTENWMRPQTEVSGLMDLLYDYLAKELKELKENQIALRAIGEIDRLPPKVRGRLREVMEETASNSRMTLNLALSYGSRHEISLAVREIARKCVAGEIEVDEIDEELISSHLYTSGLPDPDLIIRTSGEHRLSNFLLFQAAYSELYVTPTLWPDFDRDEYIKALSEFQRRERRFGLTGEQIKL